MKYSVKTKGFTLVEVLVALVILSVALLGLAGLMVRTTRNNSFGGHMTEAATFAQDKLEELRAASWLAIVTGSDRKMGKSGIDYGRSWGVATNGDLKTITMTISWNDQTSHSSHSINFLSVISQ